MIKKETATKGGNIFITNMILPTIKSPCKIQLQSREVRMTSQLRIRLLAVLNQLSLPCCVRLEELSKLLDEPIGRVQAGLYSLKRFDLTDYTYLNDAGYVVTSVVNTDAQATGCPYGFRSCDMCVFKSAACHGNIVMKGAEDA